MSDEYDRRDPVAVLAEDAVNDCDGIVTMDSDQRRRCKRVIYDMLQRARHALAAENARLQADLVRANETIPPNARLVCVETDFADHVNVDGPTHIRYKTFDFTVPPEVLEWLKVAPGAYASRAIQGVELLE